MNYSCKNWMCIYWLVTIHYEYMCTTNYRDIMNTCALHTRDTVSTCALHTRDIMSTCALHTT